MLLEDLPAKTIQRLIRSITWTEVDAVFSGNKALREFLRIRGRPGQWLMRLRETYHLAVASGTYPSSTLIKTTETSTMSHLLNNIEKRWGERVRVNIPVQVSTPAALPGIDGCLRNISLSGALMRAHCDLRLNAVVEISIASLPPAQRDAVIKAQVTRKLKEAVGLEWCEFAPSVVKDLLRSPAIRLPL